MEIVGQMLSSMMAIMNLPFTIWGYTLTLWKVFGFSCVSTVMSGVIWEVISGD